MKYDRIVHGRWVVPVEPPNTVLEHHSVVMHEGKIVSVIPTEEARGLEASEIVEVGEEHVILPGLVNMHSHVAMTLLRGLVDNLELMDWLQHHIWPAEAEFATEEFVEAGTRAGVLEFLRHGITTFNDMYFFPAATARVVDEVGLRAAVAITVFQWPNRYANGEADCIAKGRDALVERFAEHPRVRVTLGPHAPYSVSDEGLSQVQCTRKNIADAKFHGDVRKVPIHMHMHETAHEVNESDATHGIRPLVRMDRLGLLDAGFIAVHAVKLSDSEIELLRDRQCSVVHCPESNLKLGSGVSPVVPLLRAGVNVCLGTDGAASNDDYSLLGELRTAVLLSKLQQGSGVGLSAFEALQMATLNGARALGLEDRIGSLKPGKDADVIAVRILAHPVFHPLTTLAYNGDVRVTHVWVAGRCLLDQEHFKTMDEKATVQEASAWGEKIHAWKHPK